MRYLSYSIVSVVTLLLIHYIFQGKSAKENEIYVDKLTYWKSDSTLFSGKLVIDDYPHHTILRFSNGLPCGKWEYSIKGDLTFKGEYLQKNILSDHTLKLLEKQEFAINFWQESLIDSDPRFFAIEILKPIDFFIKNNKESENFCNQLVNAVVQETQNLNYKYVDIDFRSSFYDPEHFYGLEYIVKNGKPVYNMTRSK